MIKNICLQMLDINKPHRLLSVPIFRFYSQSLLKSNVNNFSCTWNENRCLRLLENNTSINRWKHSRKDQKNVAEDSDDEEQEDEVADIDADGAGSKVLKLNVASLRLDLVMKATLNISRKKIEESFYGGKIRLNGEKVRKKSKEVSAGDEIDLIRGVSQMNPNFLDVSRVQILSTKYKEENAYIQACRFKSLIIENYKGQNSFKAGGEEES